MTGVAKRTCLKEVNPYLTCPLCRGYLVDATTVVECLHSFCRTCILKHLSSKSRCPSCTNVLNKAKPKIKADKTLQDIVYKLVPGLYHKEMRRRREFYKKHPEHADTATSEQRGEDVSGRLIFASEDAVSLSLEYLPPGTDPLAILLSNNDVDSNSTSANRNNNNHNLSTSSSSNNNNNNNNNYTANSRRYLQCPALVTIAHLKKFLAMKYSIDMTRYSIEICQSAPLPEHWTLMDVAYIYAWKRNAPMRFFYRVAQEEQKLEAPTHERPSTPGLGASLPPLDNSKSVPEQVDDDEKKDGDDEVLVVDIESKLEEEPQPSPTNEKLEATIVTTTTIPKTNEEIKCCPVSSETVTTTTTPTKVVPTPDGEDVNKFVKTPLKILKNPDGKYEVLRNPPVELKPKELETAAEVKPSPEFSVVSIGNGQNSNGVKITLKQCPPGTNNNSRKPKMISNVVLRPAKSDKIIQISQNNDKNKDKMDKSEKKRKVGNLLEKADPSKQSLEQPDKKQFLHSFQLTARETIDTETHRNTLVKKEIGSPVKILKKDDKIEIENKDRVSNVNNNKINNHSTHKIFVSGTNAANAVTNASANLNQSSKMDVYTFTGDNPVLTPGAVKRKCPPGLLITEVKRRKQVYGLNNKKQPVASLIPPPKQQQTVNGIGSLNKVAGNLQNCTKPIRKPMPEQGSFVTEKNPMLSNDTRELLDGCGLNIPASLSITLTAQKASSNNIPSTIESIDPKEAGTALIGKVNPSITLNDRSVDPRVLKALRAGQIRMPAPAKVVKQQRKQTEQRPNNNKRKRDQDSKGVLDLSGGKKMDIHPLRIPQPVSKIKPKPPNKDNIFPRTDQGNVVIGRHTYYRAPPGSLTPAACRVADYPAPNLAPVYAPSLSSLNRSPPNFSSVFPNLKKSIYALSQAPNLQQFQMDARFRLPASENNGGVAINKTHLSAQCAPMKPTRSMPVPIPKQQSAERFFTNPNKIEFNEPSQRSTPLSIESSNTGESPVNDKDAGNKNLDNVPNVNNEDESANKSLTARCNDAASPRVSSTASPSPPPGDANDRENESKAETDKTSPPMSDVEKIPTSSSVETPVHCKSPASPDSSSITVETTKNSTPERDNVSSKPTCVLANKVDENSRVEENKNAPSDDKIQADERSKDDVPGQTRLDSPEKILPSKTPDSKPLTSEMLQKRLLAAFPSNEWANNPIAAEHLGNFLKSLNGEKC